MRRIALVPLIGALAVGLLAVAGPALAAGSGLDPTYGDGGVATLQEHDP